MSRKLIETEVLCFKEAKLGIGDGQDLWLPIIIDLNHIYAIKSNGDGSEFSGPNKAVMYHDGGDYFIINMDYKEAIINWKEKI